ncbi:hypothetical protein BRADI_1g28057v3 [Brachypodium distachyon]|uniref:Uncharacterized protein n=1 Tax=Brachypodium distachyon TaxID=15368 RepID=A0A2K2DLI0_BRADI|nr:hypothetical protein BRADI_1g28057v3 [Brachypodium distachyon]
MRNQPFPFYYLLLTNFPRSREGQESEAKEVERSPAAGHPEGGRQDPRLPPAFKCKHGRPSSVRFVG